MKRRDLIKHLEKNGCFFVREGGNHTVYQSASGAKSQIPRHREIKETLVKRICKDLKVPRP